MTPPPPKSQRMSLSQVVERLTEKRAGSSSATIKMSAQGQLMPEVTVTAHEESAAVDMMIEQAIRGFVRIMDEANGARP
jgi:wobble nucleotide-excising tRNase